MSAGSLRYQEWVPSLAPRRVVLCLWARQVAQGSGPYEHTSTPDGCVEIRCRPGDVPLVVGPRPLAATETFDAGTTIVGARLQPGVGPAVLGITASELVDSSVPLDQLWGPAARRLGERVAEAGSAHQARRVLEGAIHDSAAGAGRPDPLRSIDGTTRSRPWPRPSTSPHTSYAGVASTRWAWAPRPSSASCASNGS